MDITSIFRIIFPKFLNFYNISWFAEILEEDMQSFLTPWKNSKKNYLPRLKIITKSVSYVARFAKWNDLDHLVAILNIHTYIFCYYFSCVSN